MTLLRWIMVLLLIVGTSEAWAEFYRYVDESGVVRFTDDLGQVPVNQRPGVQEYQESSGNTADRPDKAQKTEVKTVGGHQPAGAGGSATQEPGSMKKIEIPQTISEPGQGAEGDINEIRRRLESKKQELDQEYQALLMEKKRVADEKKNIKTYSDTRANNAEITKLNERIKKYEENQKAFNQEIEAFNAKLEQALKQKPSEKKQK